MYFAPVEKTVIQIRVLTCCNKCNHLQQLLGKMSSKTTSTITIDNLCMQTLNRSNRPVKHRQ